MSKQFWVVSTKSENKKYVFYNKSQVVSKYKYPHTIVDEESGTSPAFHAATPTTIYFDFTFLCNLHCKHCLTNAAPWRDLRKEMGVARILDIIEELAALGVKQIITGGGEPMTHPYWLFIFKHITDLNLKITINTNGTLINERNLQYMRTVKPTEICVSFDGGRNAHNNIRGKEKYDLALKGLKTLIDNNHNTTTRYTYINGEDTEIEQLFADIAETGAKKLKVGSFIKQGRGQNDYQLNPQAPDLEAYFLIKKLGEKYNLDLEFIGDDFPTFDINKVDTLVAYNSQSIQADGFSSCYISPMGQVFSSDKLDAVEFGMINKQAFWTIWQSQKARDFRKDYLRNHMPHLMAG